ncbi:ABC transporter substrate-binding protein [Asaia siamensis]|uniref:Hemin ABC transporter substrate-binding protein n=1 Tax=Asaia siamensis TaxID=110479 RepID=A0ABQ1MF34_9PROT|nr:ABC transporter substrate-binding protein [Asaia siamensis]GBR06844.1 periplasmic binding protein [Asaia siamensis NRIC 0323]GGC39405.1 hemin ABC transporter substrate-binding protein [Asaia siamensis]
MSIRLFSRRQFGLSALATGVTSAAARSARAGEKRSVQIEDCRGRRVTLGSMQRIVSIGGTITETLYALGAADRIIGVDITSTYPVSALREKRSVGYMRQLSSEGILSLKPDLVLAMNDSGPANAIDQVMESSTPIVMVDATPSLDGVRNRMLTLSRIIGEEEKGAAMVVRFDNQLRTLRAWTELHPKKARVLFVMRVVNGRPMAAGTGTAADAIIALAGATNAGADMKGYKALEREALIALKPDVILMMSQGGQAMRDALLADEAVMLTPAGQKKAIIDMEGEKLLGFGPRTAEAALELAQQIVSHTQPA